MSWPCLVAYSLSLLGHQRSVSVPAPSAGRTSTAPMRCLDARHAGPEFCAQLQPCGAAGHISLTPSTAGAGPASRLACVMAHRRLGRFSSTKKKLICCCVQGQVVVVHGMALTSCLDALIRLILCVLWARCLPHPSPTSSRNTRAPLPGRNTLVQVTHEVIETLMGEEARRQTTWTKRSPPTEE